MAPSTPNRYFPALPAGTTPTLQDVADLIQSGAAKKVVILAGAGISTSAGIPDFRSPETGLYANLEKYNLPYPEAIFDIDYFVRKPAAFFALAKELYPGQFEPTPTHHFFRLLQDKGILLTLFTQNIDTLERIAGVEEKRLVEAHGSFARAECLECKKNYTKEEIRDEILAGDIVYCREKKCKGRKKALVKPVITFFGEAMPKRFFEKMPDLDKADLLLVLGTSLSVQPFASLVSRVPSSCPRVLFNLEEVGEFVHKAGDRDVKWLGGCDEGVAALVEALGWSAELRKLSGVNTSNDSVVPATKEPVSIDKKEAAVDVDALAEKVAGVALEEEAKGAVTTSAASSKVEETGQKDEEAESDSDEEVEQVLLGGGGAGAKAQGQDGDKAPLKAGL